MKYSRFRDWVALREDDSVQQTLQAALKSPPPQGVAPPVYQSKVQQAMKVAQTTKPKSAAQAMDLVNMNAKVGQ